MSEAKSAPASAPSAGSNEALTGLDAKLWLGAAVLTVLVALACLVFDLRLPGKAVADADYQAVAKVLDTERQAGDVVLLAPWWTERARLFVPDGLRVVGYQGCEQDDLMLNPRIWLLAEPDMPRAGLSDFMTAFAPNRSEQGAERRFGNLSLRLFKNGRAREVLFDSNAQVGSAQGYVEAGAQRQGIPLASTYNEVFYQPRKCIRLDAPAPGQRKVAEFTNVPASSLKLFAGYIWDRGWFVDGVADAELVAEVNGERHPLPLRRGDEGLKTLDLGNVAAGSTVRISTTAANPHERLICFELYGFGGAR